jgi:hypothetical protein
LAVESGLTGGVAFFFPPFTGGFEFLVAGCEAVFVSAIELVLGCDVADGRVQADGVVVFDELADEAASVCQGQRRTRADTFLLADAMPAFNLAVARG